MMKVSERPLRMFEFFIAETGSIVSYSYFCSSLDVRFEKTVLCGVINCRVVVFDRRRESGVVSIAQVLIPYNRGWFSCGTRHRRKRVHLPF